MGHIKAVPSLDMNTDDTTSNYVTYVMPRVSSVDIYYRPIIQRSALVEQSI